MLSRTTKSAAVSAAVLAAAALAAVPTGARAADECLTAPKSATPAGAHWYYRLEKGTKRKCWYLADEASKTTRTTSSAPAPAASSTNAPRPAAAKSKTTRQTVADARAELTAPEDDQPALAATTWPPLESFAEIRPAEPEAPADTPPVASDATPAPKSWTMAARWPDPAASAAGNNPSDERAAKAAPADAAPQAAPADPLRIALIVLTIALLAAAVAGRLLLRQTRRPRRRTNLRTIWPDERSDDPATPIPLSSAAAAHRARPTQGLLDAQQTSADIERIEALLRASRRATG